MFYQCLVCVLLILPFIAAVDPLPLQNGVEISKLADHEILRMFDDFSLTFDRKYGSLFEYKHRYVIFKDNLKTIDQLNREEHGTATYGVTRFADLTYDEFLRNFTGGRIPATEWERHKAAMEHEPEVEIRFMDDDLEERMVTNSVEKDEDGIQVANGTVYLPKKFDYREKNAVTPVKDQRRCSSCWAFSTNANIEGLWAKKKKELIDLSEQELVDCDRKNYGCFGGWMQDAVREYVRLGGVAKTSDYPYVGREKKCKFTPSMAAVKVKGTKSIPEDEKKMARALIKNGPLSITLDASKHFQFYKSGVFHPTESQCSKGKDAYLHAVAIVAYGEEETKSNKKGKLPFWVIKNSWKTDWGEEGYMRIIRGENACGLTLHVSTAYL